MTAFDTLDIKDQVARDKHLRVEKLVKLQTKPCGVCKQPVVYAVVSSTSGKRLPFNPSALLNDAQKVVIASDESLEVWPFAPRAHRCPSPTVYRSLRHLLKEHPDLRPLHEARGRAALARHFQASKLEKAKAEWDKALAERNLVFEVVYRGVGFADQEGPNPLNSVWGDRR